MKTKSKAARSQADEWTLSRAARVMKVDKGAFADLCAKAGIEPRVSASSHYYPIDATVALVLEHKTSKGQSAGDRRNLAQARKAEVETEILEKKWIPIADVMGLLRPLFTSLVAVIQGGDIPDEMKERMIEKLRETTRRGEEMSEPPE